MTWQSFFKLAGRSTDELLEPQPVPPLLVGNDDDWLRLSPFTLQHWVCQKEHKLAVLFMVKVKMQGWSWNRNSSVMYTPQIAIFTSKYTFNGYVLMH